MGDSEAILCQISSLKDMLDQVNEEIEANIQTTREIESEIVKCSEIESTLASRESELTKLLYVSHFEIDGLISVIVDSRRSVKILNDELSCLRRKIDAILQRINDKRDEFTTTCIEFQREIENGGNEGLVALLSEKEFLENEFLQLEKKNTALKNSMLAFAEEVLEDLHNSNAALNVEIQNKNLENNKFLEDIDDFRTKFLSAIGANNDKSSRNIFGYVTRR